MSDDNMSDEDKMLFRQMMSTVKPLNKTKKLAVKVRPKPVKLSRKPAQEITSHTSSTTHYMLSNHYSQMVQAETILTYCQQGIPRKRLIQLRSGQIPWQARLDLHGLRPDDAREALCHFIEQHSQGTNRCLLIIHGKGGLHGEAPILKNHVNHWLQQLPQVLAFHSALPRDGGSGALYVLLKRDRTSTP